MISNEIPSAKPRKKYVEVPVHRPEKGRQEQNKPKKTYSANFSSRRHRSKHEGSGANISEVIIEIPERDSSRHPANSKRSLSKEIERLSRDNEEIVTKFNELEDLSVKKILKLKEKISHLQNVNSEVYTENEGIRYRYLELQKSYEDLYNQLEISKVCRKCEEVKHQIEKLTQENQTLRKNNTEVNEDLGMLKIVVFRLNAQLERYQEKLRQHNITIEKYSHLHSQQSTTTQYRENEVINALSGEHQNHRHTPISWGTVNSHTLGPLLDAYQDTINEKDNIIQGYELSFANFTGKMKEIVEENENLYKKLTEDETCSAKLAGQLESIRRELKSTKEQNDALIKKCAIKQDKIEEILRAYESKVEQMKRDYQVVHDEYIKLRAENVSLKEKIKGMLDNQDDFKNERQNYIPISVHTASVNECKRWYEELKTQYEGEKSKLEGIIASQTKSINELNDKVQSARKCKEVLEEKIVKLEKEVKKSEAKQLDLEHTLNEVQLSRSACRKQLHKAMNFAKDMVAEQETLLQALNQRQIENRVVKKIGSEMAVRMDSLKTQLKDVQKSAWEEFSTVEHKIQEQAEEIETLKEKHQKEVEALKQVIADQEAKLSRHDGDNTKHGSHYQLFKDKYK